MLHKILICFVIVALMLPLGAWQGISYPPPAQTTVIFGSTLLNVTVSRIHIENAGSGDVDLFTVPANSRAFVIYNDWNSAGTTTAVFPEVNISGTYYRTDGNTTLQINTAANSENGNGYRGLVLEAGQKFALNTSQAGVNIMGTAYVFPNTSSIKSSVLTTLASGDNTLYTCCSAGKTTATVILGNSQIMGSSNAGVVAAANVSGGNLNYSMNVVASGGSPGTANKTFHTATAVPTNSLQLFATNNWTLGVGDFISVNVSGTCTNCISYVTVDER